MNKFSRTFAVVVKALVSVLVWVLVTALFTSKVYAIDLDSEPKLLAIANELIAEEHYTKKELDAVFANADFQQSVLDAMQNPAEYKFTWGKYRKLFLQADRIQQGVDFWNKHQATLSKAEAEFGVPASVIVAIIGVESKFGRYKGKHKVLDSLVTLVTGFPRRSKFFGSELKHFLILTKENNLASDEILGSYAGAVGFPQFISSSYRSYAVDFSGDGQTDLINQPVDAIGSIANYFIENGWKPGQPVTSTPQEEVSAAVIALASRKRKVQHTAESLRAKGAVISQGIAGNEKLGVLMLNASEIVPENKDSSIYIVRSGDSACRIAERFDVSCKSLFKLNSLNKRGDIFRGQRLKLPESATKPENKTALTKSKDSKWEVRKPAQGSKVEQTMQAQYFYTHHNFYAITQYNHSVLYAMAVHDLSMAIDAAYANKDNPNTDN